MKKIFAYVLLFVFVLASSADGFAAERCERSCTRRAACFVLSFLGITNAQMMASVPMRYAPPFVMTEGYQAMLHQLDDRLDEEIRAYRLELRKKKEAHARIPKLLKLKKRKGDL